jgi:hypothetical protein
MQVGAANHVQLGVEGGHEAEYCHAFLFCCRQNLAAQPGSPVFSSAPLHPIWGCPYASSETVYIDAFESSQLAPFML